MRWCVLVLACLAFASHAGEAVLITGVAVVDPERGGVERRRDVLVRDGRIAAVAATGTLHGHEVTARIDGRGRYLVPGLVDAHVHLEYFDRPADLALFLIHGVTGVRAMDGRPQQLAWREAIRTGALVGPRLYVGGTILNGPRGAAPDHRVVADGAQARSAVAAQARAGYDFVKVYHGLAPDTFAAVASAARAHGLRVAGHVPMRMEPPEAVTAGLHAIEHVASLDGMVERPAPGPWDWRRLAFAIELDPARVAAAARWAAASGAWFVPTLGAADWRWLDRAHRRRLERRPAYRLMPAEARRQWSPDSWRDERAAQYARMDAHDLARVRTGVPAAERVVGALHRAGARLAIGTDTPNPYLVPGDALHEEMRRFRRAGIPQRDVLCMATRGAGALLGDDALGCLRAGCHADLLLVDRDPLRHPSTLRRPQGVMVAGRWYPRAWLEQERAALACRARGDC